MTDPLTELIFLVDLLYNSKPWKVLQQQVWWPPTVAGANKPSKATEGKFPSTRSVRSISSSAARSPSERATVSLWSQSPALTPSCTVHSCSSAHLRSPGLWLLAQWQSDRQVNNPARWRAECEMRTSVGSVAIVSRRREEQAHLFNYWQNALRLIKWGNQLLKRNSQSFHLYICFSHSKPKKKPPRCFSVSSFDFLILLLCFSFIPVCKFKL